MNWINRALEHEGIFFKKYCNDYVETINSAKKDYYFNGKNYYVESVSDKEMEIFTGEFISTFKYPNLDIFNISMWNNTNNRYGQVNAPDMSLLIRKLNYILTHEKYVNIGILAFYKTYTGELEVPYYIFR